MKFINKTSALLRGADDPVHSTVMIGGMDQSKLDDKRDMLAVLIEEAKAKAFVETEEILSQAKSEAENLIAATQAELANIEQAAYDKGFERGKQEATEQVNLELSKIIQEANHLLESIKKEREEALQDEEERIYSIVTLISRKLLEKDLSISKDLSIGFIKKAINQLDHRTRVRAWVNPEAADKLNEIKTMLIDQTPGLENLTIDTDAKLNFGDIILESNHQRIDLRLETQFQELLSEINL